MTKDEALRLALEALKSTGENNGYHGVTQYFDETMVDQAITAIKAALEAKDEPEYYGLTKDHLWMSISKEHYDRLKPEFRMACYTTPPQRTWVGLSDKDWNRSKHNQDFQKGVDWAEEMLKGKNT